MRWPAGFNAAVDPALLGFQPELVTWLEAQPGQWRLTSFAPKTEKPFNANSGWLFDLPDVRGYDSIILKEYTAYMETIEPQEELLFNRMQPMKSVEALNSPLLDLLGVRYIITHETLDLPKLALAWEGEGVRVYENLAVAPRAFTLPERAALWFPAPLAALTQYDPRTRGDPRSTRRAGQRHHQRRAADAGAAAGGGDQQLSRQRGRSQRHAGPGRLAGADRHLLSGLEGVCAPCRCAAATRSRKRLLSKRTGHSGRLGYRPVRGRSVFATARPASSSVAWPASWAASSSPLAPLSGPGAAFIVR